MHNLSINNGFLFKQILSSVSNIYVVDVFDSNMMPLILYMTFDWN